MAITGSALRSKGCPGDTDKIATWLHKHELFCFVDLAYVHELAILDGVSLGIVYDQEHAFNFT